MTRVDLRTAVDMLPRYAPAHDKRKREKWSTTGANVMTKAQVTPRGIDTLLTKVVRRYDDAGCVPAIKYVDVSGPNVWVLHAHLSARNLHWLLKQNWKWQKFPIDKLPIYILFRKKIVIWNGTHRMTLGRLAGKKVRARVIDLNQFIRQEKKNAKAKHKQRRS